MIDLPATPQTVLAKVIVPALGLLPAYMDSPEARLVELAIGGQESGYRTRVQDAGGPARGLWQCESPIFGLLLAHPASADPVRGLCKARAVAAWGPDMYRAVALDDIFAAAIARLILWCDPHPLPALGDVDDAWLCYQKNWGPGKPRPEDWPANYQAALAAVTGATA